MYFTQTKMRIYTHDKELDPLYRVTPNANEPLMPFVPQNSIRVPSSEIHVLSSGTPV